jgi:hypothetical protein
MKRLLFLSTFFCAVFLINASFAQQLRVVTIDQNNKEFIDPSPIVLFPGDTLQFKSIDGEFSINIKDAYKIFRVREDNIKIRLNSSGSAFSDLFEVRAVETNIETEFSIYCISSDGWPDAPPKIIIVTE